jgi:hypothetical protein
LNAGSLTNLLLIFASISFGLDFIRYRDVTEPRPGWDDRPSRKDAITRWFRLRLKPAPARATVSSQNPATSSKESA